MWCGARWPGSWLRSAPRSAADPASADRSHRAAAIRTILTVALTAGSGSLDALAFLGLGKVFVSVITGNLVLFGIGLGQSEHQLALRVAVAILLGLRAMMWVARVHITARRREDLTQDTVSFIHDLAEGRFTTSFKAVSAQRAGEIQRALMTLRIKMGYQIAEERRKASLLRSTRNSPTMRRAHSSPALSPIIWCRR